MSTEELAGVMLIVAVTILVAVGGVRVAARIGMPGLLFYLGLGVLLGEDGVGILFNDAQLATNLGYAGLVIILAEGGLTTRPSTVRPVMLPAVALATLGVGLSILLVALPLALLADVDLRTAVLIGAVLAPTDAAAVFTVARGMRLPGRLQTLLEAESGLNDAPVVVLVVLLATTAGSGMSPWMVPVIVAVELIVGSLIGVAVGVWARWMLPRLALPAAGLYPVAVLALLLLAYGLATVLRTSGFAAVYVAALILAASRLPHRRSVLGFVEGLAWAVQIGLFVMLGLLAVPSRLGGVMGVAVLAGVLLLVLARPLSVVLTIWPFTKPNRLTVATRTSPILWRWAAFAAWGGLRGAVPIIFATIPLAEMGAQGELIFDVTLVLVILLTLVQAPTMPVFARRLGLVSPSEVGELSVEAAPLDSMNAALLNFDVPDGSQLAGTYVGEMPLPRGAVVSLVIRQGHSIVPDRHTRLRVGDRLLVVVTEGARAGAEQALHEVSRGGRLAGWTQPLS